MKRSVWFIEAMFDNDGKKDWYICSSYDYDFFWSKKDAQDFIDNNPEEFSNGNTIRISEYVRA